MLYTGTQRATCTHRMISLVVLIVHLGVDSGLGKARFPHLPSEGREVRQKFYRLSSLSFTNHTQSDPLPISSPGDFIHPPQAVLALACLGRQ